MTQSSCDALGRVAATIDALTNATTYAYDPMGRVAAITNALGHATIYEYDHHGNKTYEGGATYPVRYTYDEYGNRTTMTTYRHEPEGDTTTWLYDEASGVMTNKLYADGKGPRYTYSDDGKLATRTWARGIVTTYGYDAYGANTNETVIGVAGTNAIERYTDAYGRDAGYSPNGTRQTTLGYDEQTGRLATMQTSTQEVDNHHSTTTTSRHAPARVELHDSQPSTLNPLRVSTPTTATRANILTWLG